MSRKRPVRLLAMLFRLLVTLAPLAAAAASGYLLGAPVYGAVATGPGGAEATRFSRTLLDVNGTGAAGVLVLATVIASMPLATVLAFPGARRAVTWGAALLLLAFSLAAGFSIGLFFLPSALLLLAAAVVSLFARGAASGGGRLDDTAALDG